MSAATQTAYLGELYAKTDAERRDVVATHLKVLAFSFEHGQVDNIDHQLAAGACRYAATLVSDVTDDLVRIAGEILMRHVNAPEQAIYTAAREILASLPPRATVPEPKPVDPYAAAWRKQWDDGWNACVAATLANATATRN